jgi:hypothetical protein
MAMGNRLIEVHDYMECEQATLDEAMAALNWTDTEIRRKPQQQDTNEQQPPF